MNTSSPLSLPTAQGEPSTAARDGADPEAMENLRAFFGILAEWDEADQSDTGLGSATNPGVASDAVGGSLPDGLE